MPSAIFDLDNSATSRVVGFHVDHGEAIGRTMFVVHSGMVQLGETVTFHCFVAPGGTRLDTEPLSPKELDYWFEKQAFEMIPRDQLAQYAGKFVASKNGIIVRSDTELEHLTEWFFSQYGDVPVYITQIGDDFEVRIDTPFFD